MDPALRVPRPGRDRETKPRLIWDERQSSEFVQSCQIAPFHFLVCALFLLTLFGIPDSVTIPRIFVDGDLGIKAPVLWAGLC
jgi:hypothetical protein